MKYRNLFFSLCYIQSYSMDHLAGFPETPWWCRRKSPLINGVAGKEESDLTLTKDFFKMGDGCRSGDLILVAGDAFLLHKTLDLDLVGEEFGRLNGEPVHP